MYNFNIPNSTDFISCLFGPQTKICFFMLKWRKTFVEQTNNIDHFSFYQETGSKDNINLKNFGKAHGSLWIYPMGSSCVQSAANMLNVAIRINQFAANYSNFLIFLRN